MNPTPDPSPFFKDGVMQPYQGGDTFDLADDSLTPPPPPAAARNDLPSLPPLEVLETSATDTPEPGFKPRPNEVVIPAASNLEPLAVATEADVPKIATIEEMKGFIDQVRALRSITPKPQQQLLEIFGLGLDIYNRTEPTRFSGGLVSPVTKLEELCDLGSRAAGNLKAFAELAGNVYSRSSGEVARVFMLDVARMLHERGVSLKDPYVASQIAEAGEEAYYAMVLDGTQLSRVDLERLYGEGGGKMPSESDPKTVKPPKLSPEEKRLKMGFQKKKEDKAKPAEAADTKPESKTEPKNEPPVELPTPLPPPPEPTESPLAEYERELSLAARTGFAALIERVKAQNKFAKYGELKKPPPPNDTEPDGPLMAAFKAMAADGPNFTSLPQAHVYGVAEAALAWCKSELELLARLGKELSPDSFVVEVPVSEARASKLAEKLPRLQQAEKQNSEAIRAKVAEVGKLILADADLVSKLRPERVREIRMLTGEGMGKIVQDEIAISGDTWRKAAAERDAREHAIFEEQERLRLKPGSEPGLAAF